MGGLFHPDSKLTRLFNGITNLVCLNVLWLICCIPVFTAGAATTAMYSVLFANLTGRDDAVLKPFFCAFRDNFRQVTPLWLMNLLVAAGLVAGVFYMTLGVQTWVKVIFGIVLFLYAAASSYCYPLLARYNTTRKAAVFNSFSLSFRHLFSSACVVALNGFPVALLLIAPELFWQTVLAWTVIGFSLCAWLSAKILLNIFRKYDKKEEEEA